MNKFVKIAWRNLWRNWRRTLIALAAIALGLLLMVFMDAMIGGSRDAIYGNLIKLLGGNIQVHAEGYQQKARRVPLIPITNPDEVIAAALAEPGVVSASGRIVTGGFAHSRDGSLPVSISGIEPEKEGPVGLVAGNIREGRYLTAADRDVVLVGKALADRLKVGVDDRISLVGRAAHEQMRTRTMTIIGIYDIGSPEIEKSGVYITLAEAQSLYGMDGQVTEIAIALNSIGSELPVVQRLQAALPGREVASWMELNPDLLSTYAIGEQMIDVFALIVLLIAGIGILNLMLMAVFERTREIGLLAAMGLKSRHILGLFVLEGAFIGIVGAVVGCALGAAVSLLVGINGIDLAMANSAGQVTALLGSRLYPVLSADALLRRGITVIIIAALAALYPAWQAAHREPAESLHYV